MHEGPYRTPPKPSSPVFASQRQHLLVTIALSIMTLGVYELIWYWRRRKFFDGLAVRDSVTLPALVGATLAYVGTVIFSAQREEGLVALCSLADVVLRYVLVYQARSTINHWAKREKMPGAPSALWTFVWRFLYLQTRVNRIAEREKEIARLPRRGSSAELV